jgi:tripartite-type tricarboxylate transporter receptor subunit TctC
MKRCHGTGRALLLAASVLLLANATAQETYPNRPIRLVVHTTAGASSDVTARATAEEMGKRLGQQFVVENRSGAGGMIGAELVARAAPNGYTLLAGASSVMVMMLAARNASSPLISTPISSRSAVSAFSGFVPVVNDKSPFGA